MNLGMCASQELIDAIAGVCPYADGADARLDESSWGGAACGSHEYAVYASGGFAKSGTCDSELVDKITCTACLELMRIARGQERHLALLVYLDTKTESA